MSGLGIKREDLDELAKEMRDEILNRFPTHPPVPFSSWAMIAGVRTFVFKRALKTEYPNLFLDYEDMIRAWTDMLERHLISLPERRKESIAKAAADFLLTATQVESVINRLRRQGRLPGRRKYIDWPAVLIAAKPGMTLADLAEATGHTPDQLEQMRRHRPHAAGARAVAQKILWVQSSKGNRLVMRISKIRGRT